MRSRAALATASACAAAMLGGLAVFVPGCVSPVPARPIYERIDLPSIAACGACHQDAYEEWAQSLHHRAWTNDNVRAATDEFRKSECRPCHSPLPVLESGLDQPPSLRDFNHADGVHCLSCHGLADGVAATRTIADAPCRPRFDARLSEARLCWPCHEPTHQAFREYETSDAKALGVRCQDCHMQPRENRPGTSHGPHGGLNEEFVARALRWRARIEGGAVVVELENRCGHKFPGEIPSRSFVVRVDFPGHEPVRELLRRPHKGEDRADNRLLPDERRVLRFPFPAGASEAGVRLLFLPLPLLPEAASFVLGEWSGGR
jgi:hypothetical protein